MLLQTVKNTFYYIFMAKDFNQYYQISRKNSFNR